MKSFSSDNRSSDSGADDGCKDNKEVDDEDSHEGWEMVKARINSISDTHDVEYVPMHSYLERDLCLLEATGDGVTILPLAQRLQSYHTYDICHCMAVRKLRPKASEGPSQVK